MFRITVTLLTFATVIAAQDWQRSNPTASPPARQGHSIAYDAARQRTVLFGGYDWAPDVYMQDHWEYDGATWTQRQLPIAPSPRTRAAMCFDEQRGVMVLFGGTRGGTFTPATYFGDTWEFDGTSWRRVTPIGPAPSARVTQLAHDSARGVVVMFGGNDNTLLTDTWEYDGIAWTRRTTAAAPPARHDYAMAYDRRRGRLVIHPGYILGQTGPFETWEYDGIDWTQSPAPTTPGMYPRPAMAYDPIRGVVVFVAAGYASDPDTWEYDGSTWQQRPTSFGQNSLSGHRMSYDEARGALVLFGGEKAQGMFLVGSDETWEYATHASIQSFGSSCGGNGALPTLTPRAGSLPRAGTTMICELSNLPTNALPVLVAGFDTASSPLAAIGLPGCLQLVRADATQLLANRSGSAQWALPIPAGPSLHGAQLFAQALVVAAGQPAAVTNRATLTVGL